jgi:molybdopterin-guanine dinucleotide biosynthesis protein
MPRFLIVAGPDRSEREEVLEKLVSAFSAAGYKTGVAIHRTLEEEEKGREGEGYKRFSRAGAVQALITRGKETALRGKQGGLTPLKRIGARYFNAVDVLLAAGYFDPVPCVEACLSDDISLLRRLSDPGLAGVVCRRSLPALAVRVYPIDDLAELVSVVMKKI